MGLIAQKESKPKVQRDLAKKGPRPAILTGLIDVGIHVREYQGEKKKPCREVIPIFTLMQDLYTDEEGDKHNMVMAPFFPIKLMEGATRGNYFDFIEAVDPDNSTLIDDERNLAELLGRKCMVMVKHTEASDNKDGVVYANYCGVQQIAEDYPVAEYTGEFTVFDTSAPDRVAFDKLWDRTQDQIRTSEGYAGSNLETVCEGEVQAQAPVDDDGTDDIPF